MRLASLLLLPALASLTAAANYTDVINDIKNIGIVAAQLSADVRNFNGSVAGLPYALQVQEDAVNLHKVLLKGQADAKASPPFLEPGSFQVASALLNITGQVQSTLSNTTAKAATFADLRPIVLASLYQLKQDTDQFSQAVIAKFEPVEQLVAPAVVLQIDNEFNDAVVAYGGKRTFNLALPLGL